MTTIVIRIKSGVCILAEYRKSQLWKQNPAETYSSTSIEKDSRIYTNIRNNKPFEVAFVYQMLARPRAVTHHFISF